MKKRITVIVIVIQIILLSAISISYAKYTADFKGKVSASVAKPIARVAINGDVYISNYEQKPVNFSVYNFDANGNTSEVKMNYKIIIKITQGNAPLKYKLYRVYDNKQEEVNINNSNGTITQTYAVSMNANTEETHNYKLEIEYDKTSSVEFDKNIGISIVLQSEQVRI